MNPQNYLADLRRRAAGGNPLFAYELGLVLLDGSAENTPDPDEAALWLSRAKHGGVAVSDNAREELIGKGFRLLSADECRRWRRGMAKLPKLVETVTVAAEDVFARCRADAEHSADAALMLGDMYDRGYGCVADADQALYWYTRAMRGGNVEAARRLVHYYQSSGRSREAEAAFRLLADHGDVVAQVQMLLWYPPKPETAEPAPDVDKVLLFNRCKAAAEAGDVRSQALLGLMLMHGEGCAVDADAAGVWLTKAADAREPLACATLANLLWETEPQKAFALAQYAAQCGILSAMRRMVIAYDHLDEPSKRMGECQPHVAVAWALRLVDENVTDAMLYLVQRAIFSAGFGPKKPMLAHQMLVRFVMAATPEELAKLNPQLVMHVGSTLLYADYRNTAAIWLSLLARNLLKHTAEDMRFAAAQKLDETAAGAHHSDDLDVDATNHLFTQLQARFKALP